MKIQFGKITRIISLALFIDGEKYVYSGIEVRFVKGQLEIIKQFRDIKGTNKIIAEIGNSMPIILHISGRGVFNKKVDFHENYHQLIAVNGNVNDFSYTDYKENNTVYCSVVRKQLISALTREFRAKNMMLLGIASGPFTIMAIQNFLGQSELITSGYQLTVKSNCISSFKKLDNKISKAYRIGNEIVHENNILALGHVALFFKPSENFLLPLGNDEFKKNIDEAGQKVLFRQFGFFLLGLFFLALLGNYFYLGHLNNVFNLNAIQLAEYAEVFNDIGELEEEKQRKEALLRTSGILSKKFASFYIVNISNSVPEEITLTEFILKPTKDEIKEKYKIEVDNQLIVIKGISKSSRYLSDWVMKLGDLDWIRKVEIEEYEYEKGQGTFFLKIII